MHHRTISKLSEVNPGTSYERTLTYFGILILCTSLFNVVETFGTLSIQPHHFFSSPPLCTCGHTGCRADPPPRPLPFTFSLLCYEVCFSHFLFFIDTTTAHQGVTSYLQSTLIYPSSPHSGLLSIICFTSMKDERSYLLLNFQNLYLGAVCSNMLMSIVATREC